MIKKEDLLLIGRIIKPHGLQGELSFEFFTDIFDAIEAPHFFCELEGIFVPFFIESYRFKNNTIGLIKFRGINTEKEAKELIKSNLYLLRDLLPADFSSAEEQGVDFYIGYQIVDQCGNKVGEIVSIDDSTENVLFNVLSDSGVEFLIPVSDDYIIEIEEDGKVIRMDIPDGLLTL
jgi:16S rRNA processing protein RimM